MRESVFKALADPTRRKILNLLKQGEKTAGEITSAFDISAPSMSHHFNILKEADMIFARRDGQQIYYALNTTVFQELMTALLDLFPSMVASDTPDAGSDSTNIQDTDSRRGVFGGAVDDTKDKAGENR